MHLDGSSNRRRSSFRRASGLGCPSSRRVAAASSPWSSRWWREASESDRGSCRPGEVGGSAARVPWEWPVGALCAFVLALVTTPAGVSGALLLLPIQLSVLHVPSPAVTPTNLLFNVAAVPGGLLRFWQERRIANQLTWLLVSGTLPGVVAGAIIRVQLLSGGRAFQLVAAGVLLPLGVWLAAGSQRLPPERRTPTRGARRGIWLLSVLVGTVGGVYGIGGGSILAPARAGLLGL
jgi:uncharacterized protein